MFQNKRYMTRGVDNEIPMGVQVILWAMIEGLQYEGVKADYLQVFRLSEHEGQQKIIHSQEQPYYQHEIILLIFAVPVEAEIFVIDDGDHSTMLLAEEY